MSDTKTDVDRLMKRCQIGVGGRNALNDAHDIMAECYGTLGRLQSELAAAKAELSEDEGVINVWRGRTQRAEAECEALREVLKLYVDAGIGSSTCFATQHDAWRLARAAIAKENAS
jgi:hypothetical protein